jgi:hypothetical protein
VEPASSFWSPDVSWGLYVVPQLPYDSISSLASVLAILNEQVCARIQKTAPDLDLKES